MARGLSREQGEAGHRPARRYNAPPPEERANETKRQKFNRVIVPRINNALKDIRLLASGADKSRYDVSQRDVERMAAELRRAVDEMIDAYKKPKPPKTEFTLSDV